MVRITPLVPFPAHCPMKPRPHVCTVITLLLVWCAACRDNQTQNKGLIDDRAKAATFDSVFAVADSVLLQQPDSAPIVRISGIDVDDQGRILIGDVSEGNVKLFAPDGRLIRIIGRKGSGPGEFTAPRYPRFGPGGMIYVADAQNPRIQVFDTSGTLRHSSPLAEVGVVMGFEPVTTATYLLTVERAENDRVLVEVDSAGKVRREFLGIGEVRPTGEGDSQLWRNVRNFFLTVSHDTAYVSSSISDTLWSVHLPSGREARTRVVFPGYIRPSPPRDPPDGIQGLTAWSRSFHTASTLSSTGDGLFLPFVQGVLNNADPMVLLARDGSGVWYVVSGAPPIIGAGHGRVIALLTPNQEQVRLGFFRMRDEP